MPPLSTEVSPLLTRDVTETLAKQGVKTGKTHFAGCGRGSGVRQRFYFSGRIRAQRVGVPLAGEWSSVQAADRHSAVSSRPVCPSTHGCI